MAKRVCQRDPFSYRTNATQQKFPAHQIQRAENFNF